MTSGTAEAAPAVRLEGTVPANILPFDEDLAIDEPAYRKHLDSLVSVPGVRGVTCNGHAGEVASLDRDERRRAVGVAAETVAGRVPLVSGIYAENRIKAAALARDAEAEGADALLVMPPNALMFGGTPETALEQFLGIADTTSLPLVAFLYPQWTGLQYDMDTLLRICEIPTVVAVKEWSLDIRVHERAYEAIHTLERPVSLLSSFSTQLLPALVSGADGILSGHGSVIAGLQAQLFGAVARGTLGDARDLYRRIQRLTSVVYRAPMLNMYARMKEQLAMLGHPLTPAVRPPPHRVGDRERAELRRALVRAGLLDRTAPGQEMTP